MSTIAPPATKPDLQSSALVDRYARRITYLRVSITDRCNLRCVYCMPAEGMVWKDRDDLLTYEEILRIVEVAQELGVRKVRVTGGEPLVRRGCVELVRKLAALGLDEICMTSNGIRFADHAVALKQAGLTRVNLSLDTLDPGKFAQITRGGDIARVHQSIDLALSLGLKPKVNVVAMRGFNDDELLDLARLSVDRPITVRFVELMPFADGEVSCDTKQVEPIAIEEVRQLVGVGPTPEPDGNLLPVLNSNGPAEYARLPGAKGEVGFIAAMHRHICDRCNRVRLTCDGHLRPCLLGDEKVAVLPAARYGTADDIRAAFDALMAIKPEHGIRDISRHEAMSSIGG